MPNLVFPKSFTFRMKSPDAKAAFISENTSPNPLHCANCGGAGKMYVFIATGGPFKNPPGFGKVGHFDKTRDWWWVGQTFGDICPVCNGLYRKDEPTHAPVSNEVAEKIRNLADDLNPRLPHADD